MPDLNEILKWVREDPEIRRKHLCHTFRNDNVFAIKFVNEHSEYRSFVKQFINDSKCAYLWALNFGNRHFMKHKITDSEWAYWWVCDIGDKDFMKYKIIESKWAYNWALNIGDKAFMKQIVISDNKQNWIDKWNDEFEDDQI